MKEKIAMKKVAKLMLQKFSWFIWLLLVILWNYGFPEATPLEDVLIAVTLSPISNILNRLWKKN